MLDPQANSFILTGLPHMPTPRQFVIETAIQIQARHEKSPVFNDMQHNFWFSRFDRLNNGALRSEAKALGVQHHGKGVTCAALRLKLVNYYQILTERASLPLLKTI